MKTLSHRQYLTLHEWLKEQWDKPSRTDYYLMQLTAEVRSALANKQIPIGKCKLPPFEWKVTLPKSKEQQEKETNLAYEQRTLAVLGLTGFGE